MIKIEKLSNSNFSEFNTLISESKAKTNYTMDFYKYYDNKSFIYKYIIRKMVHLIKVDKTFVGYFWVDSISEKSTRISDMFIKEEYINHFNSKLPLILRSTVLTYECFENNYSLKLLKTFRMDRIRLTYLMKLKELSKNYIIKDRNISFSVYNSRNDAQIRCFIQNSIFKDDSRIPLTIEDIHFDEKQDYYLKDFCVFVKYANKTIGYGQIIYTRGMYLIVNFGILEAYRGKGYGAALICNLIQLAKRKGIEDIYIRVDFNNKPAIALYKNVGFEDIGNFSTWIWSKNV